MITLKHFDDFSEGINEELSKEEYEKINPDPRSFNYNSSDGSFTFEFYDEANPYVLKVFPDMEMVCILFPEGVSQYCSFSALKKNKELFKGYTNGILYEWMIRVVLHVEYGMCTGIKDWTTFGKSILGQQE